MGDSDVVVHVVGAGNDHVWVYVNLVWDGT